MTTDELNAALAAKLAPLVGEAAVYETRWRCGEGHTSRGVVVTDGSERCEAWIAEKSDMCRQRAKRIDVPTDFTDATLGWSLWDQWAAQTLPDVEVSYYEDYVFVELYTMRTSELGAGPALWPALLAAWSQVLEVNSDA